MLKNICILGSTGSIGRQTLKVIKNLPQQFKASVLSAKSNIDLLAEQINIFKPYSVIVPDIAAKNKLLGLISDPPRILIGNESMEEAVTGDDVDIVITATSGIVALFPTIKAIEAGKIIGLANKETLVVAGELVCRKIKENNVKLIPVDSEHSAIFQCLQGENFEQINKILLTASGGAFYKYSYDELHDATPAKALLHPNWNMGKKITIDCATMMNKGLEVIEAHWLFDMPYDRVSVVMHPQSIIHSMVEFRDGSTKAQLGVPDMCIPIQYALTYPDRYECVAAKLDWTQIKNLTFDLPDDKRFPCLQLAYKAGRTGGTMPAVLNGANDVCVELFLNGKIRFYDIPDTIARIMDKHSLIKNPSVEDLLNAMQWAKEEVAGRYNG